MAPCPVVSRFTCRTKYLLLLVLCACVIMWFTSLSDSLMKFTPMQVTPPPQMKQETQIQELESRVQKTEPERQVEKTEQEPLVQEQEPQVQEQEPQVQEQEPQVQEQEPQVQEQEPQVQEQEPQVQEQEPQVQEKEPQVQEKEPQVQEEEMQSKVVEKQTPKQLCPENSPLLLGAIKLEFEASLTLGQVAADNSDVVQGQYDPSECQATQSVAILIPYRNREKHLLYLLHHLHPFLQRQQLHYGIYVIHQAGNARFNRAKLLNVGYLEALKDFNWDCFIFHDVDLIPENDHNLYKCDQQPKHLVVGRNSTGYRLRYQGYFGGVTALTRDHFSQVNGFPNTYWGWGGEDDDLRQRVQLQGLKIIRPPADVARYTMVFHQRDAGNEVNHDRMRLLGQTAQAWRKDGLNSCSYQTLSVERPALYVNITVDIGTPAKRQ